MEEKKKCNSQAVGGLISAVHIHLVRLLHPGNRQLLVA